MINCTFKNNGTVLLWLKLKSYKNVYRLLVGLTFYKVKKRTRKKLRFILLVICHETNRTNGKSSLR